MPRSALRSQWSRVRRRQWSGSLRRSARRLAADVAAVRRQASTAGCETWVVTNGCAIHANVAGKRFQLDTAAIGKDAEALDQLIALAADPTDFRSDENRR